MRFKTFKLDAIDLQILSLLQQHGRMSNVDLAKRIGMSAPPCLRRVRALEEAGFITGYHAVVHASLLGYSIISFAQINLQDQNDVALRAFENLVEQWPEVRECHMLAGDADFMLRVVAKNWDDYQSFLTKRLTLAPNVKSVKSHITVRSVKTEPGVPLVDMTPHLQAAE